MSEINGTPATNLATPLNLALVRETGIYIAIPGESGQVWAKLCEGIETYDFQNNDVTQQYQFMCGQGFAANEQTGRAPTIAVSGRRVYGDPAQDYICSIGLLLGNDLKTTLLVTSVNDSGTVPVLKSIYWGCTIMDIVGAVGNLGGAATDNAPFSCTIGCNGAPTVTEEAYLIPLTVTSVAGGSGQTLLTVSPPLGAGNSYAYQTGESVTLPTAGSTVEVGSTWTTWDGSSAITATNGQQIGVIELTSSNIAIAGGTATVVAGS